MLPPRRNTRHRLFYTSPTPSPTISLPPAYAPPPALHIASAPRRNTRHPHAYTPPFTPSSLLSYLYRSLCNSVLDTFRLQHIKRRLRCLFNGYNRVTIKTAAPQHRATITPICHRLHSHTPPTPALILVRLPISPRTTSQLFTPPPFHPLCSLLPNLYRSLYNSVLAIFRL